MSVGSTFTGYQRQRKTRLSVRFGEVSSRLMITLGGMGTIIAIVLVCVFLVWVAVPLFFRAESRETAQFSPAWTRVKPLRIGIDPELVLGWVLFADGTLTGFSAATGEIISQQKLFEGQGITAISPPGRTEELLAGFSNGSLAFGKISVSATSLEGKQTPAAFLDLAEHAARRHGQALAVRTSKDVVKLYQVKAEFDAPVKASPPSPVLLTDVTLRPSGPVYCSLTADGILRMSEVSTRENLSTGETIKDLSGGEFRVTPRAATLPRFLAVNGVGDNVFLAWEDGTLQRINTRHLEKPVLAEELKVTDGDAKLTAVQFMIGKSTLLTGDSSGRVRAWFRINKLVKLKEGETATGDVTTLVNAHELPQQSSAVTSLAASARSRVMAAGYADGSIRLYYLTNQKHLADLAMPGGASVNQLEFAPKEDGLFALGNNQISSWSLNTRYPEVSFRSLLCPIWYEGYSHPEHVWQSTSGDDAFEPKFGLWPLVFGTLKATFYSLLLGVPLALFAAVYSREFLHPRTRAAFKPTIEIMASLPSVVLGFLAALIIAPFIENVIPIVFAAFLTIPVGYVLAAFLWHCVPTKWIRLAQGRRFLFIAFVLPCSILVAIGIAPFLERFLFEGDVRGWLADQNRYGGKGWIPLLFPLTGVLTAYLIATLVNPQVRLLARRLSSSREALLNLAKCLVGILFSFGLAWLLGVLLSAVHVDPRNSLFGVYVQRNAMVVGMIMGFAIIPIIYTLAEDALTAVPDHLRSASLGSGATPWQTASRIIIPAALSGIFSAVMVGLGRAVGETMIVLMAAGNTPVLEMNIFNGFRTLSANIAVELPEAVEGSTHYRTLFLAALTLFAMTFVLNTIAERLRQRFRKRAFEL